MNTQLHTARHGARRFLLMGAAALLAGAPAASHNETDKNALAAKPTPTPDNAEAVRAALALQLTASKKTYKSGEPVRFTFTARNTSDRPIRLNFNSGQRFDVIVSTQDGRTVWRWSQGRMFIMVVGSRMLAPGQTLRWNATWNQKTADGDAPPRGTYQAVAALHIAGKPSAPPLDVTLQNGG